MAIDPNKLRRTGDFADRGIYTYSTIDTKATIESANYFDAAAALFSLGAGDLLQVNGDTDGTPFTCNYTVASNDGVTVTITPSELGSSATADEITRACDLTGRIVNATGSTVTITQSAHEGRMVNLSRAAGQAVTLPAASGSGGKYQLIIGTTITSNSTTIKAANSSDSFQGFSIIVSDDTAAVKGFAAVAGTDDTITFNGTTTGGFVGDVVEIVDFAANRWQVRVLGKATGTEATPFSATV
jgi:hypothetical protein